MLFFQYTPFVMISVIIILIVGSILTKKQTLPVRLFIEAQKNENDGDFEQAVITYESALEEISKFRFHGSLKNRIIDKIKVLHTSIEYKNNLQFIRECS
jgi:hypothetical protein